jgi:glycosyltransferase involved in cell wall biosynthesis
VRALATGRVNRGLPTLVLAMGQDPSAAPFLDALRVQGVPVFEIANAGRRYDREAREAARLIRANGIDVLHTHVYRADFVGYAAARMTGIPVVSTFHGDCGGGLVNRFYEWSMKRLFRKFDGVIAVSESNRERLARAGCRGSHVVVVPNGMTPAALLPRHDARNRLGVDENGSTRVIGWIGRFSQEKGPDQFIDAIAQMPSDRATAVMVGDGPERAEIERRAERSGVRVRFAGLIPDAARLLAGVDLLVMSSRTEGLPMVLLEAFAAEVPVAGFTVGGIPQLLTERTGWPVVPGDVGALAAAVSTALSHEPEARQRAMHAREIVKRDFGLDGWLDGVENVYRLACGRSGKGRSRP